MPTKVTGNWAIPFTSETEIVQIYLKRHLRLTLMLGLFTLLAAGPGQAQESTTPYDAPILGVSPFEYDAGLPTYKWIGEYLADTVSAELSGVPGLKVVERGQIEKLFEEMKLGLSGFSEEDVEFGGLNVASHMVLGRYRIEGDEIHASIKLVEVASGTTGVYAELVSCGMRFPFTSFILAGDA